MHRIVRLETFHNEFVCFVRVTAEDGAFGWGQTSTYNADLTAQIFHRQIAPWALSATARYCGACCSDRAARAQISRQLPMRALAGLDTALWDLAGRRAASRLQA